MRLLTPTVCSDRLLSYDRGVGRERAVRGDLPRRHERPPRVCLARRRRLNRVATAPSKAVALNSAYAEVPLVFEVTKPFWSPLSTAVVESVLALVSAYLAVTALQYLTRKYTEESWTSELAPDSRVKRHKTVAGAVLRAISSPAAFILPTAAILHSFRVFTCRMDESMHLCSTCAKNTFERRAEVVLDFILRILRPVDDFVGILLRQAFLLAGIWFLVTFKNQYVAWSIEQRARRSPALLQDFKRIVIPLNDLLSWAVVGVGLVLVAGLAGVDVRPLVTLGGVSGIVVGLSAQSVLSNMIAGINLFLSRPFVAGDRVQLFANNGNLIYNGLVERINPLRTVIRTDRNYPLAVPNKLLSEMVIGNESRFPTMAAVPFETDRRVEITLKFGMEHFDKLDATIGRINAVMESYPGLNHGIPPSVNIGALTDSEVTLELEAKALKREAENFGELRIGLLRKMRDALQECGIEGYKLSF